MKTLVMKFGGAAVAHTHCFGQIADIIIDRSKSYDNIIVVISAMGDSTNQLIALAKQVNPNPPSREYDMLISVGERVSMSLLAMALHLKNQDAASFTGSQAGIITSNSHTEAHIIEVRPYRLLNRLEKNHIVIVAGFQGVSKHGDITTLGRGGSDTTAVALAAALSAEKVEFLKDVEGIYDKDPHLYSNAFLYPEINYQKALDLTLNGAKVLQSRAVVLAQKNRIPLHVLSFNKFFDSSHKGTWVRDNSLSRLEQPIYEEDI
ncbi:MAG: lysC [Chlamydiales bacterium]|jgi:aspartate kinase|nr:lysC [Chlamydiales bacterium]